jgi:hypothetical protein
VFPGKVVEMPVDTSDYQELLDILAGRRADIEAYCASSPNWEQLTEWCTTNSSYFAAIYGTYLESEQRVKNSLPCLLDDLIADGAQDTAMAYSRLMTELVPDQAPQPAAAVTAAELSPAENAESWKYSRTPGTRYYILHDDQYLYSDDKNAPLARWATAEERNEQAAARATEWETGSGVFYTSYENPALVQNVTHVFGQSRYGPWILDQSQAADLLADKQTSGGVAAEDSPVEPYFDTGHFTKYDNDVYYFGETADTTTWYPTYQELLDALAARTTPAAQEQAEAAEEGPPVNGQEGMSEDELMEFISSVLSRL